MHPLDRVPAIRRIETDREDVFAIEISDEMTPADIENLYGLLEGAYQLHDRLDLLVRLTQFEGMIDEAEFSRDTIRSVHNHAMQHARRIALVGRSAQTSQLEAILKPESPVEAMRFKPEDEPDAWTWIGAREIVEPV